MALVNTLAGRSTLAQDPAWNGTVTIGVLRTAGFVLAEGPGAAAHPARLVLAQRVLDDPQTWGRRFAQVLASDTNIVTDAPTDQVVMDTISAWWNHFAGADL